MPKRKVGPKKPQTARQRAASIANLNKARSRKRASGMAVLKSLARGERMTKDGIQKRPAPKAVAKKTKYTVNTPDSHRRKVHANKVRNNQLSAKFWLSELRRNKR